jgi:DNA adenine methylase
MPPHEHYVELFAGGLSVLLNKQTPGTELVNDANQSLVNFWRCLRDDHDGDLRRKLRATDYTQERFDAARSLNPGAFPSHQAWAFMVRNRMSRGGMGKDFAWSDRLRGGQPGDVNAWQTILADLDTIHRRLQKVHILGVDYTDAIDYANATADTLVYADPPYLHETRTAKNVYEHEICRAGHEFILSLLVKSPAIVMLSGYRSTLYDDMLAGWTRHDFDMPNHSGQGATKQRRVECLWINR